MNVARPLLNGGHQHQVHEADDRSFPSLLLEGGHVDLIELLQQLHVVVHDGGALFERLGDHFERGGAVQIGAGSGGLLLWPLLSADARRRGGRCSVVPGDCLVHRRFRGHDRFDVVPRHELDVVHGEDVRRVRHRDRQRRAGAAQRDDLILVRRLDRNQLDDPGIEVELREVDGRDAVLLAQDAGDVFVADEAKAHQVVTDFASLRFLTGQRLLQLGRSNASFLEQQLANADGHRSRSGVDRHVQTLARPLPLAEWTSCAGGEIMMASLTISVKRMLPGLDYWIRRPRLPDPRTPPGRPLPTL